MDELAGKRLVILGLARQGTAFARFAVEAGARVVISDLRTREQLADQMAALANLDVEFVLGEHPMSLLEQTDVLAISGGVPYEAPLVQAALERRIRITNDSQEFARRCPALAIGITGSAGKTTTTALTGVMAQMSGRRTWVGGNIGRPLIADLGKMGPGDLVVQELSSFQLEIWNDSPRIAAVLNVTPNHLDRHRSMRTYVLAKANILRHQSAADVAVLAADDPGARIMAPLAQGRLRWFSTRHAVTDGAFVREGQIWLTNGEQEVWICEVAQIKLRGAHNVHNVLAAVTLADSANVPVVAMRQAIQTFAGVEHRLELVATIRGVQYVNDSIATSPERALAALNAYEEPIILLAGGRDKDMAWDEWAKQVWRRTKGVVLFGELAAPLGRLLAPAGDGLTSLRQLTGPTIQRAASLAEAVTIAARLATAGDVVLLAPGGTSFDAFTDFAERGNAFRQLVGELA